MKKPSKKRNDRKEDDSKEGAREEDDRKEGDSEEGDRKKDLKIGDAEPGVRIDVQRDRQNGRDQQAAASEAAGRGRARHVSSGRRCLVAAVF